jgi:hypothetical protein
MLETIVNVNISNFLGFKDDDFIATVAHSEEETCKLIEARFDFVCDYNGNKTFRKRKGQKN